MGLTVFKTVARSLERSWVGSTPIRLCHRLPHVTIEAVCRFQNRLATTVKRFRNRQNDLDTGTQRWWPEVSSVARGSFVGALGHAPCLQRGATALTCAGHRLVRLRVRVQRVAKRRKWYQANHLTKLSSQYPSMAKPAGPPIAAPAGALHDPAVGLDGKGSCGRCVGAFHDLHVLAQVVAQLVGERPTIAAIRPHRGKAGQPGPIHL